MQDGDVSALDQLHLQAVRSIKDEAGVMIVEQRAVTKRNALFTAAALSLAGDPAAPASTSASMHDLTHMAGSYGSIVLEDVLLATRAG